MEDNKYFTPDIKDFHIGYECEINTSNGWKSGKFPEILELNGELDEFGKDSFMKAAHAILRVPYLTKEQIEAEGWELIQIYPKGSCVFQKETKEDGYELTYDFTEYRITFAKLYFYYLDDKYTRSELTWRSLKCKDINTFRKICKLLEI